MALFTYVPSKVFVEVAGFRVSGLSSVTASIDTPHFKTVKGIRGVNTRVQDKNTAGTLTIEVLQTSQSNDVFSDIVAQDFQSGTGRLVVQIKDESGSSVFFCDNAYFEGFPQLGFSDSAATRVWKINCLSIPVSQLRVGGNYKPAFDIF